MSPVRQAIKSLIDYAVPDRYLVTRLKGADSGLVVTFDDGPDPSWTRQTLDALDGDGIKGTFFLVGQHAEQHPDLVREIVTRGHTVGDHTYSHSDLTRIDVRQLDSEVLDNLKRLSDISGQDVRLFRPPYGKIGLRAALYLARRGVRIVMWSLDSTDYRKSGAPDIMKRIADVGLRSGDILLFHDDNQYTIEALPQLAAAAREQGLRFENLEN